MPEGGGRLHFGLLSGKVSKSSFWAKTATANSKRRYYVVRTLRDWVRDLDRRTDLCGAPGAHARALDCRGRDRTLRHWDSVRCKGHASERSFGITAAVRQLVVENDVEK